MTKQALSIVMLGPSGAVGGHVANTLIGMPDVGRMTLLGRRVSEGLRHAKVAQAAIDVFDPASYEATLPGHHAAICTLGVGQPSTWTSSDSVSFDPR